MQLDALQIERKTYGADKGKFIASLRMSDEGARITLALSPEISSQILRVCQEEIAAAAERGANEFRARLQEAFSGALSLPEEKS